LGDGRFRSEAHLYRIMSLRQVVAYPFQKQGRGRCAANDFVAALSLDRGWFDPDAAEAALEAAVTEGLVERVEDEDAIEATFDYAGETIPEDFDPDREILQSRSIFEVCVDRLVDAGVEKREAVAGINRVQENLAVTLEAAAVVFARRHELGVADLAQRAREEC
jgi:hypothetical protein